MPRPEKGAKLIGPYAKPKARCSHLAYRPGTLQVSEDDYIAVGSPAWLEWLQRGLAVRVEQVYRTSNQTEPYYVTYTLRPERRQRGGLYWYAYKKHQKRRLRAYLGQTEAISLPKLEAVALQFLAHMSPELYAEVTRQGDSPPEKYHNRGQRQR